MRYVLFLVWFFHFCVCCVWEASPTKRLPFYGGHFQSINQPIKFYLYSPYLQITIRLIELDKVRHPLSLTLNKSQEKQKKKKSINLRESHMWGVPLPGWTEVQKMRNEHQQNLQHWLEETFCNVMESVSMFIECIQKISDRDEGRSNDNWNGRVLVGNGRICE